MLFDRSLRLFLYLAVFATLLVPSSAFADQRFVEKFINDYCVKCHGPAKQKADRRFDQVNFSHLDEDAIGYLEEALDAINLGEMPPEDSKQPKDDKRRKFVAEVTKILQQNESDSAVSTTVLRRLTRSEYRNTIRDLLNVHTEAVDATTEFPAEMNDEGFTNVGGSQVLSDFQLQKYLEAAQTYIDKSLYFGVKQPKSSVRKFGAKELAKDVEYKTAKVWWILNVDNKYVDIGHGEPVERVPTFPRKFAEKGVPHDGYYEIRVRANAINRLDHPYEDSDFKGALSQKMKMGLWIAPRPELLERGASQGRRLVKIFDLADEKEETYSARLWLTKGSTPFVHWANGIRSINLIRKVTDKYHPEVAPAPQQGGKGKNGKKNRDNKKKESKNYTPSSEVYDGPRVRIYGLEIEGPTYESWPPQSHQIVAGKSTEIDELDIGKRLMLFGQRAFRRKLSADELNHYESFVKQRIASGDSKEDAFKLGLSAILVSPRFLYLDEGDETADAELSSYELATRLSYFLWSTMPDNALYAAAANDKLKQPEVLSSQIDRMLRDPKAIDFVDNFSNSWLRLDKIGSMPPDTRSFSEYYALRLESAMRKETRLYIANLLANNGSIVDFLDSNYTYVNDGLARLYDLEGDFSETFERFELPKNFPRGGLLTQASILTLTANGVETSPVTRGVWVLENILGTPPNPPPPDVEPLEPDTRGAVTIREQLKKHRHVQACADCHKKIDPLGFPLEYYDPIGRYRTKYPAGRRKGKGKPVDGSGVLSTGEKFQKQNGLKRVLTDKKDQFTRALADKLLVYGTGRKTTYRDHDEIQGIAKSVKATGYGFKDLVKAVATSEAFRNR